MKTNTSGLAFKVALIYLILAATWIFFSDRLLGSIVSNHSVLVSVNILADLLTAIVTAGLLHWYLRHHLRRLDAEMKVRQQAQDLLRESEKQYRMVMEAAPDSIFILHQNHFVQLNPAALKLLGARRAEELIGRNVFDFIHPDFHEIVRGRIAQASQQDEPLPFLEERLLRLDGSAVDVEATSCRFQYDGKPALLVELRDITERKRAECLLLNSEERYRGIYQQAGDGIVLMSLEGELCELNEAFARMHGYTVTEMMRMKVRDLNTPETNHHLTGRLHRIATEGSQAFEVQHYHKDGHVFPIEISARRVLLDGKYHIQSVCRDITERKAAEQASRESEERFSRLFASNPVASSVTTIKDGRYLSVNEAWLKIFEWSRAEVIGRTVHELNLWVDLARQEKMFALLNDRGRVDNFEIQLRTKSGKTVDLIWSGVPLTLEGQDCLLGAALDITEQRTATGALRETQALYDSLVTQLPVGVFQKDKAGRYTLVNQAFCRIKGMKAEDFLGRLPTEVTGVGGDQLAVETTASKYAGVGEDHHRQILRSGKTIELEEEYTLANGRKQFVRAIKSPVTAADGKIIGTQGILIDITYHKQTANALQLSEAFKQTVLDSVPAHIAVLDHEGMIIACNARWNDFARQNPVSVREPAKNFGIGVNYLEVCRQSRGNFSEEARIVQAGILAVLEKRLPTFSLEYSCDSPQEKRWFSMMVTPMFNRQQYVVVSHTDITARKRSEEAHARLATAVEQAAESIVITDTAGTILYVNPMTEKTSGYTRAELLGCTPRLLKSGQQDDEFYRELWSTISHGNIWRGHFINRHKDDTLYDEEATISPVRDVAGKITHYVAVKRNVTHELELEAQIRQAQKMEAIGQLAGGVAHDFNNILAVIQLQAGMLKTDPSLTAMQVEQANDIEQATNRGAALTRQLLLFSRKQSMQMRDHDLNDVVNQITKMLQRVLGEHIEIHISLAGHPLAIHADAGMIDQILMNLTVNARDAMPHAGKLFIETATVHLNEIQAAQLPSARPGTFACLTVRDTGCGMPPAVLARIFEPFFTTKELGKGTGMGLASVFGIVQQHHGWINVTSTVGQGTTFRVFLPGQNTPTETKLGRQPPPPLQSGQETILLVEDDAHIRLTTGHSLTHLGYRVLAAGNGIEALALWQTHSHEIQLVLTDLLMPGGLSGRDLSEQLLPASPHLKIIYMSGYTADLGGGDFVLEAGVNFLPKPFEIHQLAKIIRDCLDRKGTAPGPHQKNQPHQRAPR